MLLEELKEKIKNALSIEEKENIDLETMSQEEFCEVLKKFMFKGEHEKESEGIIKDMLSVSYEDEARESKGLVYIESRGAYKKSDLEEEELREIDIDYRYKYYNIDAKYKEKALIIHLSEDEYLLLSKGHEKCINRDDEEENTEGNYYRYEIMTKEETETFLRNESSDSDTEYGCYTVTEFYFYDMDNKEKVYKNKIIKEYFDDENRDNYEDIEDYYYYNYGYGEDSLERYNGYYKEEMFPTEVYDESMLPSKAITAEEDKEIIDNNIEEDTKDIVQEEIERLINERERITKKIKELIAIKENTTRESTEN